MPLFRGSLWHLSRPGVLSIVAGCTSYQPVLELWPTASGRASGDASSDVAEVALDAAADSGTTSVGPMDAAPEAAVVEADAHIAGSASDAGIAVAEAGALQGPCTLSVTMTTVTNNGGFSPSNIGAIWIAQGSGTFVKTLAVWARTRISHLTLWNSTTAAAGLRQNTVDAVTGATLSSHQTHKVSWNCTDAKRSMVPDGAYRVYFEMTDDNVTGPSSFVDFPKGLQPVVLSPADTAHFTGVSVTFVP